MKLVQCRPRRAKNWWKVQACRGDFDRNSEGSRGIHPVLKGQCGITSRAVRQRSTSRALNRAALVRGAVGYPGGGGGGGGGNGGGDGGGGVAASPRAEAEATGLARRHCRRRSRQEAGGVVVVGRRFRRVCARLPARAPPGSRARRPKSLFGARARDSEGNGGMSRAETRNCPLPPARAPPPSRRAAACDASPPRAIQAYHYSLIFVSRPG